MNLAPMRVAIEAASLTLSSGGLARYTSELSLALARCFPQDEYFLISDQPFTMPGCAPPNLKRGGAPNTSLERRWWIWGITRELERLNACVVHGPDFAVPYIPTHPSVLTLHDLSPWMDPEWHADAERVARRTPVLLEMGLATLVITPSQAVRRQAIERFRLRPDRVVSVPEAAPPWLKPTEPRAAAPYFLYVGTLEPRKNLPLLIEAWREVRKVHAVELVIAGRLRADYPPIAEEPGLRVLGEVADGELSDLYSGALAVAYPSSYEGFGLPVLEAMQCGACVIASRAVEEAAGAAAEYASTAREFSQAMAAAVEHPEWREKRRALSLARAGEFSWERTACLTRGVYAEALKRFEH
jgi:glycosyltransferase involved in cell wall biosynthesis